MPDWKPIADPALQMAVDRYRSELGRDPREDQPDLDGDEGLLGVYLIMMGYPPGGDERVVVPFRARPATPPGDT